MRYYINVLTAILALAVLSCSESNSRYERVLDNAEQPMHNNTDSALSILETIDPSELAADSLRARYHYLKGYGHLKSNRSMIGDSLVGYSHEYYSGKDIVRDIRSGMAFAWYKFWTGDTPGAMSLLDSLAALPAVPDSIIVQALRVRVLLGASEYQGHPLIPLAKRLFELETDTIRKIEAKYMLLVGYEYAGVTDSALCVVDELIDYARRNNWGEKQFMFELEKAQLLTEDGQCSGSDAVLDEICRKAGPENGAADYIHFQYAINSLNIGDHSGAAHHLAMADSIAMVLRADDDTYYRSYSNLLHAMIDFRQNGVVRLRHINGLNNRQNERYNRMKASQWESERGALHQQNRALALKAESEHKTVIILAISVAMILIIAASVWFIVARHHRERENEERIEALQKMVEEYNSAPAKPENSATVGSATLRSAMLKQLGIIKMVAETPTEQNREMLRKISSIDGEIQGELVDWANVFAMIDSLYSGFYSELHNRFGESLSAREEQIIVLMVAGFSTKEISVITGQTTATVYVRKSSIRKKLGVPEKDDIVRFLLNQFRS